jgi:osmotically-inducible protein OsmY
MHAVRLFVLAAVSFAAGFPAAAAPWQAPDQSDAGKPKVRRDAGPTADDQKMNPSDRELARKIRRSVVEDKTLSMQAHNVKIIARDGAVTLRGAVKSEDEKASIEQKASAVAGAGKVTNELTVGAKARKTKTETTKGQ